MTRSCTSRHRSARRDLADLPLATGDKVRLFRQTMARIDGRRGIIGSNGDVVTIVGSMEGGLKLRDAAGRVGDVEWRRMMDPGSDRLLLGSGHALTIDSACGDHERGAHQRAAARQRSGIITAFKAYTAESRHVTQVSTMISEAAVFEAGEDRPSSWRSGANHSRPTMGQGSSQHERETLQGSQRGPADDVA